MMYNRLPCVADDSCQFSNEHIKQLDCSHYLGATAEASDGEMDDLPSNPKADVSVGREGNCVFSVVVDKVLKTKPTDIPYVNSTCVPASALKSSWVAENSSGIAKLENAKRPLSNHSFDEVVHKRARHEEQTLNLEEFLEIPSVNIAFDGKLSSDIRDESKGIAATTASEGNAKNLVASNLSSRCLTYGGEVESRLDQHDRSCFPGYYGNNFQRTRFYQLEDLYSPFSEYFHWKHVSIGPDHQADVPEYIYCSQTGYNASSPLKNETSSSVDLEIEGNGANKWLGTCVMPTPDLGSTAMEAQSCKSRSDCDCLDAGSIRCVRHHVMEARESLERTLGNEKFMGLGFRDMGEVVAQRWTKEEENLFLEVVLSNPASLGRNFWPLLSLAFPSRSGKELVSYYFNVFIHRRRAEQNRSNPLNVDSDNDEWQDSSEDEFAMSGEEEESSVVESPFDGDDAFHDSDLLEQDETDSEDYEQCIVGCEDDGFPGGSDGCRDFKLKSKHSGQLCDKSSYGADDLDVQDDSCTSFEGQFNVVDDPCHEQADDFARQFNKVKHGHENLHAEYRNDGISGVTDYEYIDDHRDSKLWDINYIVATEKVVEFLPTCHVIEEMLGNESWEEDARDGRQ